MLDDAVAAFLESTSERGFDEPLMALLRASGFERVRRVHGSAEFGKDVIAQREGKQWAFQSKAGNINQTSWRQMTGQLDELRLSRLAHPDFDLELPRQPVLVTTGRLSGNAPLSAQEYNARAREREEPELEIWDRDLLLGKISGNPDAVLSGAVDGELLSMLGAIDGRSVTLDEVEIFSRRWISWEPSRFAGRGIIEAAIACEGFVRSDRLDLACQLGLCAVRGTLAAAGDGPDRRAATDPAAALFEGYARRLWAECDDDLLSESPLVSTSGPSSWVTYPLRCVRLAELLGLLALLTASSDLELSSAISDWLVDFVSAQPGAAHVVGDRYAVSLVPITLALARSNRTAAMDYLRRATIWLCDRYDRGELGLAEVDSDPEEEISRLLGGAFEVVRYAPRRASQAAAVILDLAALMDFSDLYADVRNDTVAVGLYPNVLLVEDEADQLVRTSQTSRWQLNVDYADHLEESTAAAPHLSIVARDDAAISSMTRAWELLAVSSALRDRHFPTAIRAVAEAAAV